MIAKALFVLSILSSGAAIALLGWEEFHAPRDGMRAHFQEGTRLLQAGSLDRASRELRFALVSPDSTLRFSAHHNLALVFLRRAMDGEGRQALGWAREAVLHGEEALGIRPGSGDSAWNLEMALQRVRALEEEQEDGGRRSAQRLLASFRLQEEGTLTGAIAERLRGGEGLSHSSTRGPAW